MVVSATLVVILAVDDFFAMDVGQRVKRVNVRVRQTCLETKRE